MQRSDVLRSISGSGIGGIFVSLIGLAVALGLYFIPPLFGVTILPVPTPTPIP